MGDWTTGTSREQAYKSRTAGMPAGAERDAIYRELFGEDPLGGGSNNVQPGDEISSAIDAGRGTILGVGVGPRVKADPLAPPTLSDLLVRDTAANRILRMRAGSRRSTMLTGTWSAQPPLKPLKAPPKGGILGE